METCGWRHKELDAPVTLDSCGGLRGVSLRVAFFMYNFG